MDTCVQVMPGRLAPHHLSQIQEETNSREHSTCFLPPINPQQQKQPAPGPGQTSVNEVHPEAKRRLSDPASLALYEQQRELEDNRSLLEELGVIEAELRKSLNLDIEREQEAEFLRQQENKLLWQGLSYLSLNQRVAKPWVSSYFRKFPMHIYCLPVQAAGQKKRKRNPKKKK